MKVNCDGFRESRTLGFNITKIKGKKKVKKHAAWARQLSKKLK